MESRFEAGGEYDALTASRFAARAGLGPTQARMVDVCYSCIIRRTREAVQAVEHGQDRRSEAIIDERVSGLDPDSRERIRDRLMTFSREASAMRHRVFHPLEVDGCALCRRAAA